MKLQKSIWLEGGYQRDYGKKIREARENAGVSQKELAEAIGYESATALSLIESSKRNVSAVTLDHIISVLHLSYDYFVKLED